jgi:hypothetical protein
VEGAVAGSREGAGGGGSLSAGAALARERSCYSMLRGVHVRLCGLEDALEAGEVGGGGGGVPPAPFPGAVASLNQLLFLAVLKPRMKSAACFEDYAGALSFSSVLFTEASSKRAGGQ